MADPFVPPFKTGFVDNTAPQSATQRTCVEYPFEWHDGNPDDEDRNGYGVSLKEGKLVVGVPSIGVASAPMNTTLPYNGWWLGVSLKFVHSL